MTLPMTASERIRWVIAYCVASLSIAAIVDRFYHAHLTDAE